MAGCARRRRCGLDYPRQILVMAAGNGISRSRSAETELPDLSAQPAKELIRAFPGLRQRSQLVLSFPYFHPNSELSELILIVVLGLLCYALNITWATSYFFLYDPSRHLGCPLEQANLFTGIDEIAQKTTRNET